MSFFSGSVLAALTPFFLGVTALPPPFFLGGAGWTPPLYVFLSGGEGGLADPPSRSFYILLFGVFPKENQCLVTQLPFVQKGKAKGSEATVAKTMSFSRCLGDFRLKN